MKAAAQSQPTITPADTSAEVTAKLEKEHATLVESLNTEKASLQTELTSNSNKLAEAHANVTRLTSELDTARAQLATQTSKVTELESSLKEKETEGEDLLLLLETNSEKISAMKGRLRDLGQQVSDSEEEEDDDDAD